MTHLDVRICCTCWGVRAKVKCASSNRWLELDAEDTKGSYSPACAQAAAVGAPIPGGWSHKNKAYERLGDVESGKTEGPQRAIPRVVGRMSSP